MKFYDNLILNEGVIVIFVYLYFHSIKSIVFTLEDSIYLNIMIF